MFSFLKDGESSIFSARECLASSLCLRSLFQKEVQKKFSFEGWRKFHFFNAGVSCDFSLPSFLFFKKKSRESSVLKDKEKPIFNAGASCNFSLPSFSFSKRSPGKVHV